MRRSPALSVDIIIRIAADRIVLVQRRNPPHGYALPGGFVDYGESLEVAAAREAKEETGLDLTNLEQFRAYSDPARDPRQHTVTVVFTADAVGEPRAGDDAAAVIVVNPRAAGVTLVFDHARILNDYCSRQGD
jgi:ADP-ribose pyrophosphatase YjhB (NUDIX family)